MHACSIVVSFANIVQFVETVKTDSSLYNYINHFAALDLKYTGELASGLIKKHSDVNTSSGYGIMNSGCLNHAITSTSEFSQTVSSTDDFLSVRSAFEQYLSGLSDPSLDNGSWVMSWTDGCHLISCAVQCTSNVQSSNYNNNSVRDSL